MVKDILINKQNFKVIFDALECPMIYCSANGIIIDANNLAITILKLASENYIGSNLYEHCRKNHYFLETIFDKQNASQNSILKETYPLKKDEDCVISWQKIPLSSELDNNLDNDEILIIGHNITPEQNAIDNYKDTVFFYENILSKLPTNVYWKDKNSVYIGCNERLAQSMGLPSRDAIRGMTDFDFDWGRNAAESFIAFDKKVMETGKALTTEDVFKQANGSVVTVLTNKTPLINKKGKTEGVLAISVDITDRKKMEKELHQAKIAAEAASHAKTEFIANMSHDIRTPLTGIIGMSQVIEDKAQNNEERNYAGMLHASGEQLLSLLNSVLEVVSSDNVSESDIHKESFDLRASVESIAALEHPTVAMKGIELKIEIDKSIPACVVSDQTKIHRILLNLLGNAIKFTKKGYVFLIVILLGQKKI